MILNPEHSDSRFSDNRRFRHLAWPARAIVLMVGLFLAGCASVPQDYPRSPSTAFADYLDTRAGTQVEEVAARHPGKSGFTMIGHGRQAFTLRVFHHHEETKASSPWPQVMPP